MNTTYKTLSPPMAGSTWKFARHYMDFVSPVHLLLKKLAADLKPFGYYKCPYTHGLLKQESRLISFTLVVDDFGVKYINKEDAEHLESAIKANYPYKVDWSGLKYIGINLDWNYNKRKLHSSMPGYVKKALKQFDYHQLTMQKQNSPSLYITQKIWFYKTPNDKY